MGKEKYTMRVQRLRLEVVKESNCNYNVESPVSSPGAARDLLNQIFNLEYQSEEVFVVMCMNTKNKIVGAFEVSRGTINASMVHPREVFKRAIAVNAASIIISHNHPSGEVKPSKEDKEVTKRLKDAGNILGIPVLDHLIIGDDRYYSFKEEFEI
jgi:DNA repair protein RadC